MDDTSKPYDETTMPLLGGERRFIEMLESGSEMSVAWDRDVAPKLSPASVPRLYRLGLFRNGRHRGLPTVVIETVQRMGRKNVTSHEYFVYLIAREPDGIGGWLRTVEDDQ